MTRDEMVKERATLVARLDERKQLSDFDAHAAPIRELLAAQIKILDHLIERLGRRR